ncbi:hypothetical protein BV326_05506 [Pseudomonas syringae pv. actinidiae]|nr:hypothetical protein BV326_05506 [Pseudomonas syringae pv. actinidiae]OSR69191.1 hypothetical protein BV327_04158 [Pseudomonas syringae pv. actinidiae]
MGRFGLDVNTFGSICRDPKWRLVTRLLGLPPIGGVLLRDSPIFWTLGVLVKDAVDQDPIPLQYVDRSIGEF